MPEGPVRGAVMDSRLSVSWTSAHTAAALLWGAFHFQIILNAPFRKAEVCGDTMERRGGNSARSPLDTQEEEEEKGPS